MKKSFLPYLVPFAAFLILTYAGAYSGPHGIYIFYPIKTLVVGGILLYYASRKSYPELQRKFSWLAVLVGILVFVIWVSPEEIARYVAPGERIVEFSEDTWIAPQEKVLSKPFPNYTLIDWLRLTKIGVYKDQFDPYKYGIDLLAWFIIAFRLAGAVIVVPIFEELFWRSFALRWLIKDDFLSVPIGAFTWFSFAVVTLGFGFEHHEWLVGLIAGVLYAVLLYKTKRLFDCVLAHAVTNLLLGIYVLSTQQWHLW